MLRDLQPFAGCSWTKDLRTLSNPDKHKHLSPLQSKVLATIKRSELVPMETDAEKGSLRIYYDAEIEVLFTDGRPVRETLEALTREVSATIQLFKGKLKVV